MVKSGSFKVSQGSTAGRIGAGIGKGLGEAIPKEAERYRLSQGLKQFEQEAQGLTPLQQYIRLLPTLSGTPHGAQALQALPEILKQQQFNESFKSQGVEEPEKFPEPSQRPPTTGLTTSPGINATRKGYIPPTIEERNAMAKDEYEANPQRFGGKIQNAIAFVDEKINREKEINQAYQQQRTGEQNIQNAVQSNLQAQSRLLGAKVPGEIYSDIEQRAVKSVLPKEEGGEGLTDEEAKIKYGKELDEVSRQYNSLSAIGNWSLPSQKPNDILRNLKSIREQFKARGDLRNLADTYISENGLSPGKAYHLAYPVSDIPELSRTISKLPNVNPVISNKKGFLETKQTDYNPNEILNQMNPKLLADMGVNGSPLSVAEELDAKGYDSNIWLDYCNKNRKKLTGEQADQLNKPRSFAPNLNDIWLFKLSDQDKYVE